MPDIVTICGLLVALSSKVRLPVYFPKPGGVNVTLTLHLAPAASVDPQAVEKMAKERGHEVVCVFDVGRDEPLSGAEVLIDFSHAAALDHALAIACDNKLDMVVGTTGWNDRAEAVRARIEQAGIGCVYASNFSPGAYAAGMEERPHSQKKDAPSGTALRIAREVKEGSEGKLDPPVAASRVGSDSAATCSNRWFGMAGACACMCRSGKSGSRTSCVGSASGRRTWDLCCGAS